MKNKRMVQAYLNANEIETIKCLADEEGISVSAFIRRAVRKYVAQLEVRSWRK